MTEAEWLACEDPGAMRDHPELAGLLSQRRLRLFAVASCRTVAHLCPEPRRLFLAALDTAERFADGSASAEELTEADRPLVEIERRLESEEEDSPDVALSSCKAVGQAMCLDDAECPYHYRMVDVILHVGDAAAFEACPDPWANETRGAWTTAERSKRSELATLVRDIFGNPFRPLAFDPAWRTTDVTLLARGIYEEKAFDRLPILADALQDAGCEVADILDHLRDPKQTHVRGCSALDLVLGKA